MNINSLNEKLQKIQYDLKKENDKFNQIITNLSEYNFDDPRDEYETKQIYYSCLDKREKQYQIKND